MARFRRDDDPGPLLYIRRGPEHWLVQVSLTCSILMQGLSGTPLRQRNQRLLVEAAVAALHSMTTAYIKHWHLRTGTQDPG